ncbi:NTF2 fold immunity protein [Brenneria goodwinii]|uniref:NTF2 fold immunity protein domain-containing protein n=1 Tax=Brenneria goodwinii TaxID=1109412 RepID=A0A0G4JYV8_9GAMM|nr:NTF2 fold immunity protein [Brenneria goodwinii]CPR19052.1 hypothetical protein BN1221_03553c [Brenneria goodwinii]
MNERESPIQPMEPFDAQAFTLQFATLMNEWEAAFCAAWRAHGETYIHGAEEAIMAQYREKHEAIQRRYREQYREIFVRYCTDKVRKYGGPDGPMSAGMPTQYDGLNAETPCLCVQKNKNRIEVTWDIKTAILPRKIMFIILRRQQQWRIDSYKYQFTNETTWNNGIL